MTSRLVQHEIRFQNAAIAQAYKQNFEKAMRGMSISVKRNVLSFQCREGVLPGGFFEKIATYRGYVGRLSIFVE